MPEILQIVTQAAAIFLVIFALNVVPAFAPPTWTALSYIAVSYRVNLVLLVTVGAAAATTGRLTLAKLSKVVVRQKLLSKRARENVDEIKVRLEKRPRLTFGIFLLYAFSPFPSNNLFIAYGLTGLDLRVVSIPFLIGRLFSYSFWAAASRGVARHLALEHGAVRPYFSYYFLASQLFTLLTIYLFTRVDWHALLEEKKLRLRK